MKFPRVRFTVRLMALVLLLAVWMGWTVHQAAEQRHAIQALRRGGGQILYQWQWKGYNPYTAGKPRAPRWLVEAIGPDYFGHVRFAMFPQGDHPPEWWKAFTLAEHGQPEMLQELSAEVPSRTDALLPQLGRLAGVQVVQLGSSDVTDAGLAHLERSPGLTNVYLDSTRVTDAGLGHLRGLTKLEFLSANNTRVTDAGLAHLRGLTRLRHIFLRGARVTDEGLKHLEGLTDLQSIDLSETKVTNEGAQALRRVLPAVRILR